MSRQPWSLLFLPALCAASLLGSLSACPRPTELPPARLAERTGSTEVVFVQDLVPRAEVRELSGLAWDAQENVYWSVSDASPHLVRLVPSHGAAVVVEPGIDLQVSYPWDGEGIALAGNRLFVANEIGPRIDEFEKGTGRAIGQLGVPRHFSRARKNKSLESLSASPSGRFLFFANESALEGDGSEPTVERGSLVRLGQLDLATGKTREFAYLTDATNAVDGSLGVSDLAATTDDELLVMERAFAPSAGNRVRVYRARLSTAMALPDGQTDVGLATRVPKVVPKALVFDVERLTEPPQTKAAVPPQKSPLLENYEGLTLGPLLPSGERLLLLIADDNADPEQTPRLLGLRGPW